MAAEHNRREYEVYLRGPVGLNTFGFCTTNTSNAYRAGVQHQPLMATFPEPSQDFDEEFGLMAPSGFTVEIADEGTEDWFLLLEDGSLLLQEDLYRFVMEY